MLGPSLRMQKKLEYPPGVNISFLDYLTFQWVSVAGYVID